MLEGVEQIIHQTDPYQLASRKPHNENTVIKLDNLKIGGGNFTLIAGPCAVENPEQITKTAKFLKEEGINFLRAGAYKPRTSPYSFQGLGEEGLILLGRVKEETGLKIVTEALDINTMPLISEYADIIQIGTRNMQNFPLLKSAGAINKPILLKRGMTATLNELLLSAEYILKEGNPNVILCERGIRTFNDHSRTTLDLGAIPVLKEKTHLPVLVDPSHACGHSSRVPALSRAALSVGADGLLIEVHDDPASALSDGLQSLDLPEFSKLYNQIQTLAEVLQRKVN